MSAACRWSYCFLVLLGASVARAEVVKLDIQSRAPFAGGMAFGAVGPYEKIVGVARIAVDPKNARNRIIVDLDGAPRNAAGKVEFESDFFILAPKDPSKGNGAILYDVNNRGNKLALAMFNEAPGSNDPSEPKHAGNGFLLRKGYTLVWCGWIGELAPGNNRLLMKAPIASADGKPIRGLVRQELVTEEAVASLPLSRRPNHGSYRPTKEGLEKATLTWRMRETDPRVAIPRAQWALEIQEIPATKQGVAGTLPPIHLKPAGGFRPGYIYELIYEAEGPIVQGLGFAATRDLVSFLKHEGDKRNPLAANGKSAIQRAHGFGVSQSGRFLRTFLYLGFNADEQERKVFDGLIPHVAGGGLGYFNFRFAQPNRHNGQHEDHAFPADFFPFTYGPSQDAYLDAKSGKLVATNRTDSILKRLAEDGDKFMPKVMHTQSAAEYWNRAGALVHTDPLGKKDAKIPDNVRIYSFGGTQHGPSSYPPTRRFAQNLTNPGNYKPFLRGLLEALDEWTREGTPPPPSVYPRLDERTLVAWDQASTGFPSLPGVRYPQVIQRPSHYDHGPDCWTKGVMTVLPPRRKGDYVVLVPRSDADGNDLGSLLPVEVSVPLATYTGWNLRRRDVGAEDMLASLMGSYIPFAKSKAERLAVGDPRLSLEERHGDFAAYQGKFKAQAAELAKQRYLLPEDVERLTRQSERYRPMFGGSK